MPATPIDPTEELPWELLDRATAVDLDDRAIRLGRPRITTCLYLASQSSAPWNWISLGKRSTRRLDLGPYDQLDCTCRDACLLLGQTSMDPVLVTIWGDTGRTALLWTINGPERLPSSNILPKIVSKKWLSIPFIPITEGAIAEVKAYRPPLNRPKNHRRMDEEWNPFFL